MKKDGEVYSGLNLRPFCEREYTNQVCVLPSYQEGKFKVDLCVSYSTKSSNYLVSPEYCKGRRREEYSVVTLYIIVLDKY